MYNQIERKMKLITVITSSQISQKYGYYLETCMLHINNLQHSGQVWSGYLYLHYPPHTRILKLGKTQTQSNGSYLSNWDGFGQVSVGMSFDPYIGSTNQS